MVGDCLKVECQNHGCIKEATHYCEKHHNKCFCDTCRMLLHSKCTTHVLIDGNDLYNRAKFLVELVEDITHNDDIFKIGLHYDEFRPELQQITDMIADFEHEVIENVKSGNRPKFGELMDKAD